MIYVSTEVYVFRPSTTPPTRFRSSKNSGENSLRSSGSSATPAAIDRARARRAATASSQLTLCEFQQIPRPHLRQRGKVGADHIGDFGIAAGWLPVGHQHQRRAVAGRLDRAEGHAVRDDVVAFKVL